MNKTTITEHPGGKKNTGGELCQSGQYCRTEVNDSFEI